MKAAQNTALTQAEQDELAAILVSVAEVDAGTARDFVDVVMQAGAEAPELSAKILAEVRTAARLAGREAELERAEALFARVETAAAALQVISERDTEGVEAAEITFQEASEVAAQLTGRGGI